MLTIFLTCKKKKKIQTIYCWECLTKAEKRKNYIFFWILTITAFTQITRDRKKTNKWLGTVEDKWGHIEQKVTYKANKNESMSKRRWTFFQLIKGNWQTISYININEILDREDDLSNTCETIIEHCSSRSTPTSTKNWILFLFCFLLLSACGYNFLNYDLNSIVSWQEEAHMSMRTVLGL